MLEPIKRRERRGGPPHPIDVHVGTRVRLRRNVLGMSQTDLSTALGLTFQQVQKYERGANRIGASRLLEIARVLDVPISFFYDDIDPLQAPPVETRGAQEDVLHQVETLDLVTAYYSIADPTIRRRLFDLLKALAAAGADGPSMTEIEDLEKIAELSSVPAIRRRGRPART